jgi:4-hydroxy-tetrahydrodipicolinate synthase
MFQGSMVAIATPMHPGVSPDAALDMESLERLVEYHIENGTDAIVSVGTTGESATLDESEHCDVIRRTVDMVRGRIPVIAGTGANSTTEAIRLTRCAMEAGANACLLVTPYYNKPTQEGLFQHHKAVAEAVPIPQILYNVPGRTAVDMLPETIGRLAKIDNIIGVKEATGDLDRVDRIRELCGKDFVLVSGDDATTREFILRGGNGVISVTANVAPRKMHDMCVMAMKGDASTAAEIDQSLAALHKNLFIESNPIPVKWVLHKLGLIKDGIRLPLTWLAKEHEAPLYDAMRQAKLI